MSSGTKCQHIRWDGIWWALGVVCVDSPGGVTTPVVVTSTRGRTLHHGVKLYKLALGRKRRCWAVHARIGFETSALGRSRRRWVVLARTCWRLVRGVGARLPVFGFKRWCWILHVRVGSQTPALSPTYWRRALHAGVSLHTPVMGSRRWLWVVQPGVGS